MSPRVFALLCLLLAVFPPAVLADAQEPKNRQSNF
jgi:hypothetical protein